MPFRADDRNWPLLLIEASGDSSDQDLEQYLGELSRKLAQKVPHVVVVDATLGKSLKATHRKMVADWNRAHAGELRRYRLGLALVTPSALLRGLITAVYWIFPAPFPYRCFDSTAEARKWGERLLRGERPSMPVIGG